MQPLSWNYFSNLLICEFPVTFFNSAASLADRDDKRGIGRRKRDTRSGESGDTNVVEPLVKSVA